VIQKVRSKAVPLAAGVMAIVFPGVSSLYGHGGVAFQGRAA